MVYEADYPVLFVVDRLFVLCRADPDRFWITAWKLLEGFLVI